MEETLQSWPSWPKYSRNELAAVTEVIQSNQLFAAKQVRDLEIEFSKYLGVSEVVGVGNATQALHLALAASNIGQGDEVIVTNCSWISTASCILMQNAVPIFVDIDPDDLGPDPKKVEEAITNRTKAIITVHVLGYPSKIEELRKIADNYHLILIEDASHAPGAKVGEKMLGTFGDISVFSFHQRKAISTGDGGVACTSNLVYAEKLRRLRSFGDQELSYNYRMTEFAAALGKIGLKNLDRHNEERISSAHNLKELLADESWVKIRNVNLPNKGVYYAIAIEVNLVDSLSLQILRRMNDRGVPMRCVFSPLNKHPHFRDHNPARGLPWKHPNYSGSMKNKDYAQLEFPVSNEFCQGRILELYAHPGTKSGHLKAFAKSLKQDYVELSPGNTREKWIYPDSKSCFWE